MNKIRLLITGGTIDDLDYDKEENAPEDHQSLIPKLLKQARITGNYEVEILMQKDSRVITDKDREFILDKSKSCPENKIIVSHGTFTLPDTARYLGRANINKTIVLFGSAVPANKVGSDALFNMGGGVHCSPTIT